MSIHFILTFLATYEIHQVSKYSGSGHDIVQAKASHRCEAFLSLDEGDDSDDGAAL